MGPKHDFGDLSQVDIDKLRSVVNRKSSRYLSEQDRQDITSHILEDAVKASIKSGESVLEAMFSLAQYPSYYVRPTDDIMEDERHRFSRRLIGYDSDGDAHLTPEPADPLDFTDTIMVAELIDHLPLVQQLVLVASDLDHDTIAEAAADLDIPRSTAHRYLKVARAQMLDSWLAS